NRAVMSDMIARPHDDIAPHRDERLNDVVLHYDRVRLCLEARPHRGAWADVTGQSITLGLGLANLGFTRLVDLLKAHCDEQFIAVWREPGRQVFERHNWQSEMLLCFDIGGVDAESDHVAAALFREVVMDYLGNLPHSENDEILHILPAPQ